MRLKRAISLLALLVLACGGGSTGGQPGATPLPALNQKVEVTFWHALTGNLEVGLKQTTDQFNSSQDKVHVTLVQKGGYPDLRKALLTALAAGSPPDLAQCIENHGAKYNESKALADLTPYINAQDGLSKDDLKDIFPVMLSASRLGGRYYMFPLNKSASVLYYNQDMFAAKGLTRPPATWEEFFKNAHALADPAAGVVGAEAPAIDTWISMLYGYGGKLYDSETNPKKAAFNSDVGIRITKLWQDAIRAGDARLATGPSFPEQVDFQNQKAATYMSTQVSFQFLRGPIGSRFRFAEAALPSGPTGLRDEMFGANACIFSKSSQAVQHGAFLYIKYFTSTDSTASWAKTTSYLPVRLSAYRQLQDFYAQNPSQAVGSTMLTRGQLFTVPFTSSFDDQRDAMTNELMNVWLLRKDPKAALDTAAAKVTDLLTSG